jgi:hypothetical protein
MPLYAPSTWPGVAPAAGQYIFTSSPATSSTNAALGNGTLRLAPWVVTRAMAIDRIGAEITTVGEAGSKLRLGIYTDNGSCFPGALLLDAGQIAGDSATVQDLTVSLTLPTGLYWIGGVVQSAATTQPTVRVVSNWTPPVPISGGTSAPAATAAYVANTQTSVSGALPATFTATAVAGAAAVRVHVRAA